MSIINSIGMCLCKMNPPFSFSIFHSSYIYTDSLPVNLKEAVARDVLEQAKLHPKLQHLSKLCSLYLEKYALKTSKLCLYIMRSLECDISDGSLHMPLLISNTIGSRVFSAAEHFKF